MSNEASEVIAYEAQPSGPAPTPMHMLQIAVQRGMDPATLKELMDLQERYQATEARKAFVQALNAFKANPPEIFKNKSVNFGGGKAAYKHATLDNVSGAIGAALSKHGLSHRWDTEQLEGGLIRVTCVLTHELGHTERTPLQASPDTSGSKNSIQAVGSTVTYLQRYTLLSATGMAVADQDDDGAQGKGKEMPEGTKANWLAAIDACADIASWEKCWQDCVKAASAIGDIPAYDELKAAAAVKRKALLKNKETV